MEKTIATKNEQQELYTHSQVSNDFVTYRLRKIKETITSFETKTEKGFLYQSFLSFNFYL